MGQVLLTDRTVELCPNCHRERCENEHRDDEEEDGEGEEEEEEDEEEEEEGEEEDGEGEDEDGEGEEGGGEVEVVSWTRIPGRRVMIDLTGEEAVEDLTEG